MLALPSYRREGYRTRPRGHRVKQGCRTRPQACLGAARSLAQRLQTRGLTGQTSAEMLFLSHMFL